MCVSSRLATWERRVRTSALKGSRGVAVKSSPSSIVKKPETVSCAEKMWSTRAVPKSSRMVCKGLLKTSAMPQELAGSVVGGVQTPGKSGSLTEGVGQRFSSGYAELIALEGRSAILVEEVGRV